MKKILRLLIIVLLFIVFWPFFLFKLYGNDKPKSLSKTIIIANHYSNFDPFLIKLLFMNTKIHFVATSDVKKKLLTRWFTWLFDCIYVNEDSFSNVEFVKSSIKILNSGGVICIFPEGIINPRKFGFFDFKRSYLYLAKKTDTRILPLYIYPNIKLFKKSKIYIGKAIEREELEIYKNFDEKNIYIMSLFSTYSVQN